MTILGLTLEQWREFEVYIGLAGPLLFFAYLPFVLGGFLWLAKRRWRRGIKFPALIFYVVAAYILPLGDITVNSMNMARVCDNAGLKIKRTVVVDGYFGVTAPLDVMARHPYKFVEDSYLGKLTRFERSGSTIAEVPITEISAEWEHATIKFDEMDRNKGVFISSREVIRNRNSGEVIAEYVSYSALSGWVDRWVSKLINNPLGGCYTKPLMYEVVGEILIPRELEN